MKQKINFRFSLETVRLLEELATSMGISQTRVLELAIQAFAIQHALHGGATQPPYFMG